MKRQLILLTILFYTFNCSAQYVGLNKRAFEKLGMLISSDTGVNKLFSELRKTADTALKENPNPRDTIVSEGHLNTHPDKIASVIAMQDFHKIYALTILYKQSGIKIYGEKAIEFLIAWAAVNKPLGNPINDSKFDDLFEAYDIVRPEMNHHDHIIIDTWLSTMADAEIRTAIAGKTTSMNNWQSHRLKVVGQIGFILNEKKYIDLAMQGLLKQIDTNLNADGSSWDFVERDALHYHAYDLEPLLTLAILIQRAKGINDFNFVSLKGSSLKLSVDWFVPYITGEKTHAEFTNSKVPFDKARAKNNEKGYAIGNNFDTANGFYTLSLAAFFDQKYLQVLKEVTKTASDFPDWQSVLNKLTR